MKRRMLVSIAAILVLSFGWLIPSHQIGFASGSNRNDRVSVPLANTVYVDAFHGNDNSGDGSEAAPWRTITHAMGQVSSGNTIFVKPGTYNQASGEIFPISLLSGVRLTGASVDTTLIAGNGSAVVIYIGSDIGDISSDTAVSDLTIMNGAVGVKLYAAQDRRVSPAITNVRLTHNGTGLYISTSDVFQYGGVIDAEVRNSEINENTEYGVYMRSYGYNSPSQVAPLLSNCVITGNSSDGIYLESNPVSTNHSITEPAILDTLISGNGGNGITALGIYQGIVKPKIERSWISNNSGWGFHWSQGINGGQASMAITNTVVSYNQLGGLYLGDYNTYYDEPAPFVVTNSTITGNSNYGVYWVKNNSALSPSFLNTILWNEQADDLFAESESGWTTAEIQYSDIEDGDLNGQAGNISSNPRLLDDIHLGACSPAMNAGTMTGAPGIDIDGETRPQGISTDIGADEYEAPCDLQVDHTVSADHAQGGDILDYTMTLTNTTPGITLTVGLTDTLDSGLAFQPGSLEASQGTAEYHQGVITWNGLMLPGDVVNIQFQGKLTAGGKTIRNSALMNVAGRGFYRTPEVRTEVGPFITYLPAVHLDFRAKLGIYGFVTIAGSPAQNIVLLLRYYDGNSWSTYATTGTDQNGYYSFMTAPALGAGQIYYVRYINQNQDSSLLSSWWTNNITSYAAGSSFNAGNFDLANIALNAPAPGANVSLPTTFGWSKRTATPSDSYELNLFLPGNDNPYYYTNHLGYVDQFTLTGLPTGFQPGATYGWYMAVYSPDGGYGESYYYHEITFTSGQYFSLPLKPWEIPLGQDNLYVLKQNIERLARP